jgi:hypothetical protein
VTLPMNVALPVPLTGHRVAAQLRVRTSGALVVWLGAVVGSLLLAYSVAYAGGRADTDQLHFHLFWAGELAFFVPALVWLLRPATGRGARVAIVAATGAFDYLPKYFRDPTYPLFHDELLHSRQLAHVVATGAPFQPSPTLAIVRFFPGLHTATAALEQATGAPAWVTQTALLLALHVIALVGVFLFAEEITRSARIGGLAAFAYALNPSFLFFDTQFAYESLGVVFFIWVLVALVKAERAPRPAVAAGWVALGVMLGAASVITHHMSSYVIGLTLLVAAATAIGTRARRRTVLVALLLATALTAAVSGWTLFVASGVVDYLSPHIGGGIGQLMRLVAHEQQQTHTLFAHSTAPAYEQWAGRLAQVIVFGVAVFAVRSLLGLRARSIAVSGLLVFSVLYFASLPFMYTSAGNEGARRSWAFTYLGVAVLLGLAGDRVSRIDRGRLVIRAATAAAVVVGTIVLVGNVAAGINAYYRFPGPASTRSEVRTVTPELRAAAAWLKQTQAAPRRILADEFSSPALAFFGDAFPATPSAGFPTWQVYLSTHRLPPRLEGELRSARYSIVVANAMIPLSRRFYSTVDEVGASSRGGTSVAIARFDRSPWLLKLYGSDKLAIYRIDFDALQAWLAGQRQPSERRG